MKKPKRIKNRKEEKLKNQTFTIQAVANVRATIEIHAENWEDALQQAQKLGVPDFMQPTNGNVFEDWKGFEITGVFKLAP